ncbi:MAG: NAD(P)/FAD-dependent oxidoreductase [Oscillospiraceae bacterium]|jgi:2,4-dienoyl-CoA reductase-like NADH-dependent reductase (Old Yellow Enzyme family)/thioredoxin reductase|nr:NAD(P)/FAD-dependent oxidoreductase [Oscillospiraceae bacterium]
MSDIVKFPHLFEPITLAGTLFRNRLFASPTGASQLTAEQYPTADTRAYFERKAIGGAASVCVGDAVVDFKRGRANANHMPLDDLNMRDPYVMLADSLSKHGAIASIELQHGGGASKDSASKGFQIYGVTENVDAQGHHVLPYTDEVLEDVIKCFADAAAFAKRCGFGMVTIHGGHGWLISQFVSPVSNTRTDKWGGSVENRCRLPVAILDAIRKAVGPKFPIEIRISGSECHPRGYDVGVGIEIAKQLDGHCDLIHVSAGDHEVAEVFTVTHPSMFLEDGVNVKYAAEIKKHVKTPVATVGALSDPAQMEEIIASGKADVVEVARGLIADPDLPRKARAGKVWQINRCMRCLTCFSHLMQTGQFVCAINPEIGRELSFKPVTKAEDKKRVLVVGGGVAGMEAAITAAKRGHSVKLYEKSSTFGGILNCERDVPFKVLLEQYLKRQIDFLFDNGVDARVNREVTPELVKKLKPDVIIAAFGAKPVTPPIKGIELALEATYAYTHLDEIGKKVVVIGGGLVGQELGLYLAMKGREVTIVEQLPFVSDSNILQSLSLSYEFPKYGVKREFSVAVTEVTATGVNATVSVSPPFKPGIPFEAVPPKSELTSGDVKFDADTVVYACGLRPERSAADALKFMAPEFYQIGDCVSPTNIYDAVIQAYHTSVNI